MLVLAPVSCIDCTFCDALMQSYAGKYIPALGYKIHVENMKSPKLLINLKGLAIGDGLCDPENVHSKCNETVLIV